MPTLTASLTSLPTTFTFTDCPSPETLNSYAKLAEALVESTSKSLVDITCKPSEAMNNLGIGGPHDPLSDLVYRRDVHITEEQFTAAMHQAVALKGSEYRYPKNTEGYRSPGGACLYRNSVTGEPACLIGVALSLINPDYVPRHSNTGAHVLLSRAVPRNVASAARAAQTYQDQGMPWGAALAAYNEAL